MLGEGAVGRKPNGPWTTGLSASVDPVGHLGVGQVRNAEEDVVQLGGDGVGLAASSFSRSPERPAFRRQPIGGVGVSAAPERAQSPWRELVDAFAGAVAGGYLAQPGVELGGVVELVEELWPTSAGHRRQCALEVGAQQADVDHRAANATGLLVPRRERFGRRRAARPRR